METKFARGRSSEAYKLDDGKVLKLFFADYPKEYAEKEFKNTKIASDTGCTSMKVYEMIEQDGRTGIIIDYIDGISQNDMPTKNPAYLLKGGKDLARCHQLVHTKKSHDLDDVRRYCVELLDDETLSPLTEDEKQRAKSVKVSSKNDGEEKRR